MFDRLIDKIQNTMKDVLFHVLILAALVTILTIFSHLYTISDFITAHTEIATKISEDFKNNSKLTNTYISNNHIYLIDIEKQRHFELLNKNFTQIENLNKSKMFDDFKIDINKDVSILIPSYIVLYKFNTTAVGVDASHVLYSSFSMILLIIVLVIIMNFMFNSSMKHKNSKIENLTISTQEYVLSERTTSYLVNIMHHKLNTPLKVLSTKSRMLIETIVSQENIDIKIKDKSELDYLQIDKALKTIFNITNKLKTFNELSQHETNIYKLCTLSKETIDILKDDEFTVEIDYKTKLYDIDKSSVSSHEIIQIFINQIKFSLAQLADRINFKIFQSTSSSITILYTDNGNMIEDDLKEMIKNEINVSELLNTKIEGAHLDLILNFNILNSNPNCSIKILSSNKNGNLFEIKLPAFKKSFDKKR